MEPEVVVYIAVRN